MAVATATPPAMVGRQGREPPQRPSCSAAAGMLTAASWRWPCAGGGLPRWTSCHLTGWRPRRAWHQTAPHDRGRGTMNRRRLECCCPGQRDATASERRVQRVLPVGPRGCGSPRQQPWRAPAPLQSPASEAPRRVCRPVSAGGAAPARPSQPASGWPRPHAPSRKRGSLLVNERPKNPGRRQPPHPRRSSTSMHRQPTRPPKRQRVYREQLWCVRRASRPAERQQKCILHAIASSARLKHAPTRPPTSRTRNKAAMGTHVRTRRLGQKRARLGR